MGKTRCSRKQKPVVNKTEKTTVSNNNPLVAFKCPFKDSDNNGVVVLIISLISDTCNSEGDKSPGIQCRNKLNVQHKWNDYRKAYQRYMQY